MVNPLQGRPLIRINHNPGLLLTHTRMVSLSILIPSSTRTNILNTRNMLSTHNTSSIRNIHSTRNILSINTLSTLSPSMATGRLRNRIYSLICNLGERPLQAVVHTLNLCWYLPRELCKMLARRLRLLGNLTRMCPYSRRSHIGTQRLTPAGLLLRPRSLRPSMHTSSLHTTRDNPDRGSKSCLHRCSRLVVGIQLVRRQGIGLPWRLQYSQDTIRTCKPHNRCRPRQLRSVRPSHHTFNSRNTEHRSQAPHGNSHQDHLVKLYGRRLRLFSRTKRYLNLRRQYLPVSPLS